MTEQAAPLPGGEVLTPDPWLQRLLDRPCFALARTWTLESLLAELPRGRCFVSAKVPVAPLDASLALQGLGFRVVDTALTFEATGMTATDDRRVRVAQPEDRQAVGAIAAGNFSSSRFHLDPSISNAAADRIKAAWAENYFTGRRGDLMLVAQDKGEVVGFLQALRSENDLLVIDLIAVAQTATRQGLACAMIGKLAAEEAGRQALRLRVGTQAANLPSCRLYESLGFRLAEAKTVLHFHGQED
ncbi:GNAT family N-acetyltransferase [Algihabitans albus]|uniref:GNAT family N-acetyltransferase n=1 Tax=Algihabitans albus TaxID=2164067 RepID=UPI000E5D73E6|nr:GNAT family N-acetyltransferase [Algihabitans albus]